MPCPISTIGITSVTAPLRSMRMKAFGANAGDVAAAAKAGRSPSGRARLMTRPPPTAAPALRKLRRSSRIGRLPLGCGAVDRSANALVRAAAADVAGHGCVDVGIARLRGGGEQRRGRHDLPRLA